MILDQAADGVGVQESLPLQAGAGEQIQHHPSQRPAQPLGDRDTEALLRAADDPRREPGLHGALEDVLRGHPPQLPGRRQAGDQLHEAVVQHRRTHLE